MLPEYFGFPTNYTEYRTGRTVGGAGIQPLIAFQPIPDPLTGRESEGANDIVFAPPGLSGRFEHGYFSRISWAFQFRRDRQRGKSRGLSRPGDRRVFPFHRRTAAGHWPSGRSSGDARLAIRRGLCLDRRHRQWCRRGCHLPNQVPGQPGGADSERAVCWLTNRVELGSRSSAAGRGGHSILERCRGRFQPSPGSTSRASEILSHAILRNPLPSFLESARRCAQTARRASENSASLPGITVLAIEDDSAGPRVHSVKPFERDPAVGFN